MKVKFKTGDMASKSKAAFSPRESGTYIAKHADHVSINEDGIKVAAKMVSKCTLQLIYWWNFLVVTLVSVFFLMAV